MKTELIEDAAASKIFSKINSDIYKHNNYFRGTEKSIEKLVLHADCTFSKHATIKKFVIRDGNNFVGRFALINDHRLADYVQVSFFEAQKGLGDIFNHIKNEIVNHFQNCKKIVVGLNGHLNYGAGILLNHFDEVPLFGLSYNPDYYKDYFKDLNCRKLLTFRFSMQQYYEWIQSYNIQRTYKDLKVRFMDKRKIRKESAIYTYLNNNSFENHPYWAFRDTKEDLELFYPFRYLLDNENLIFAEINGNPVGFFLWYPDFNQLLSKQRDLNIFDVIKYRLKSSIDTFRFTEIGILPQYQGTPVALALINKSLPRLLEKGYKYCEGGFIFEDNLASIAFVKRILSRCYGGKEPEPYRQYAIFETSLK